MKDYGFLNPARFRRRTFRELLVQITYVTHASKFKRAHPNSRPDAMPSRWNSASKHIQTHITVIHHPSLHYKDMT